MKRSKRYRTAVGRVDRSSRYSVADAVALLKGMDGVRDWETVEISLLLGIDPKQGDQIVRGSVSLPNGVGATKRVVVFAEGEQATAALEAGAVAAGGDDLIEKVNGGWMEFDVSIAIPRMMPRVGRLGRVLGPKGLMPSPKTGTVTEDVVQAVKEFAAGKIEFRNDAGGNIHAPMGKVGFGAEELVTNIQAFIEHIEGSRPASSKGTFLRKGHLSSTMSPSIPLSVAGG